jgi:DNA-binding transcriptional regulator YiaG
MALSSGASMTSVKPGSKYFALYEHLRPRQEATVRLSLPEIEALIGSPLPNSARTGRSFWSNRAHGALQGAAWMAAGYHVVEIDLAAESVTFARPSLRCRVRREGEAILWDGDLIQALRAHMGMNQAELADVLGVRQQTISEWETGAYAPTRARSKHLTMVAERADFPFGQSELPSRQPLR